MLPLVWRRDDWNRVSNLFVMEGMDFIIKTMKGKAMYLKLKQIVI
jgi:hypothetical protein